MNYKQALNYLYNLMKEGGMKFRLSHTRHLMHLMGDPHRKFKSVHVGGTNGKGSVCAMLHSVLRDAGFKTGLYTSPHLMEFTDRFRVDGQDMPKKVLARMVEDAIPLVEEIDSDNELGKPTFFEVTTSIAFKYFAEKKVDFAVVEVGLGGRLDSTNVIKPLVSVITNVQYDHTEILGEKLSLIAREKAGIIKEKTPVVTAELKKEAFSVIWRACRRKNAPLYVVGKDVKYTPRKTSSNGQTFDVNGIRSHINLKIPFLGSHQLANASVAVTALDTLNFRGVEIQEESIRRGLEKASWPGRFEVLNTKPNMILDCAHNPAGAETLAKTLSEFYGKRKRKHVFVLGVSSYKNIDGILSALAPKMKAAVTAKSQHPQAASTKLLCRKISAHGLPCNEASSIKDAITKARNLAGKEHPIVFAGSIFFVGDARKILTLPTANASSSRVEAPRKPADSL